MILIKIKIKHGESYVSFFLFCKVKFESMQRVPFYVEDRENLFWKILKSN